MEGDQGYDLPQQAAVIDVHAPRVNTTRGAGQQAACTYCCTTSGMSTPQQAMAALLRTMLMRCEEDVPEARASRGGSRRRRDISPHATTDLQIYGGSNATLLLEPALSRIANAGARTRPQDAAARTSMPARKR
jgi:hypothetical protein